MTGGGLRTQARPPVKAPAEARELRMVRQSPVPPPPDDASGETLADRVEKASRSLLALSIRAMAQLDPAISPAQLRALMVLDERGSCNQGELAEAMHSSASATSRLVDRLATAGHLDRRVPEHNRREVVLTLSPSGQATVTAYQRERRAVFTEALAGLAPGDLEALLQGLEAVHTRETGRTPSSGT